MWRANTWARAGKIEDGVVPASSLWGNGDAYYSLDVEPYTPESYFIAISSAWTTSVA